MKWTEVDQIGPKWTEWTKMGQMVHLFHFGPFVSYGPHGSFPSTSVHISLFGPSWSIQSILVQFHLFFFSFGLKSSSFFLIFGLKSMEFYFIWIKILVLG